MKYTNINDDIRKTLAEALCIENTSSLKYTALETFNKYTTDLKKVDYNSYKILISTLYPFYYLSMLDSLESLETSLEIENQYSDFESFDIEDYDENNITSEDDIYQEYQLQKNLVEELNKLDNIDDVIKLIDNETINIREMLESNMFISLEFDNLYIKSHLDEIDESINKKLLKISKNYIYDLLYYSRDFNLDDLCNCIEDRLPDDIVYFLTDLYNYNESYYFNLINYIINKYYKYKKYQQDNGEPIFIYDIQVINEIETNLKGLIDYSIKDKNLLLDLVLGYKDYKNSYIKEDIDNYFDGRGIKI